MKVNKIEAIESIILCKLSKLPIGELMPSCVTSFNKNIDEVPFMTLKINKYFISQDKKEKVYNPLYDEIKVKRYLFINNEDYYLIEEIDENKLSNIKEIKAYKGEQKLNKFPIEIEDIGIQLVTNDPNNEVYTLNDLLLEIGWKLNHVDTAVAYENGVEKMRWQESINTNWLDFIKNDIAEQFDCLPLFDTINKTIDLIDINSMGEEIKLFLSKDNYLKSKQKTIEGNEFITLLKLKGDDELDIREYLPSAYDFITDFSYFIEIREMSNELVTALNKYDEMVAKRYIQWKALVDEKISKQKELDLNRTLWQMSISTLERYKYEIEKYKLMEDTINESLTKVSYSNEADNELILRFGIDDIVSQIGFLEVAISEINKLCRYETCTDDSGRLIFNKQLLNELSEFIFMDEYKNDAFTDGNMLLEKGKKELEKRSKPTVSITVDSINFMNRIIDNNFRLKWNGELYFGDIIVLIDDETGEEEYYYFVGYDIDYESNKLTLKISNKKTDREDTRTINTWLKEIKNTKSLLLSNRYLFNDVKKNRLNMK